MKETIDKCQVDTVNIIILGELILESPFNDFDKISFSFDTENPFLTPERTHSYEKSNAKNVTQNGYIEHPSCVHYTHSVHGKSIIHQPMSSRNS